MRVLNVLLADLPSNWEIEKVYVGTNWVLSLMVSDGKQHAALASAPELPPHATCRFQSGVNSLHADAREIAQLVQSPDPLEAAVGMATLNGLLRPDPQALTSIDAADWLAAHGVDKRIAFFGRFPFIADEIQPVANRVWIFERHPEAGEYGAEEMAVILPHADIIAITSSTLVNHTLDHILPHVPPHSTLMLLGPSTPLSDKLFSLGFDLLSGVQVLDIQQAIKSVEDGVSFRQMQGVGRVTLCNESRVRCKD